MDVSRPIRSIVPSLDGPVLEALARSTAPATLTTVHQRTGEGSISGVRNVLERLVEHGVAVKGPGGYALNRDHLAAEAILSLAELHGRFAERLRAWVDDRPERVLAAGVYGSMARRDGGIDSDIDLLLVTSEPTGDDLRGDCAAAVETWTGNRAQVVVFTTAEIEVMRAERHPMVETWRRELNLVLGDRSVVVG